MDENKSKMINKAGMNKMVSTKQQRTNKKIKFKSINDINDGF